eukprot:7328606-Lingulodinium_polyedra.AAC.1
MALLHLHRSLLALDASCEASMASMTDQTCLRALHLCSPAPAVACSASCQASCHLSAGGTG